MTTSIEQPRTDFEVNAYGTLNVLEAARLWVPKAPILYSSTNKVYGDLGQFSYMEGISRYRCVDKPDGIDEGTKLDFHSPYGCSKGAADQYMLDYARIYDLNTVVFRHSSMYGGRQFASYDQGWVGWFCMKAIEAKKSGGTSPPFTISGNGKQVRDVLHADDMVRLYFGSLARIASIRGQAFNIGGGKDNSLSLLELFSLLEKIIGVTLNYVHLPVRESDQRVFIADIRKAQTNIGWTPEVSAKEGVAETLRWIGSLGDHWTGR
jgi:CDP-paratose 2-epimerase